MPSRRQVRVALLMRGTGVPHDVTFPSTGTLGRLGPTGEFRRVGLAGTLRTRGLRGTFERKDDH
jgi:hypothetical protein